MSSALLNTARRVTCTSIPRVSCRSYALKAATSPKTDASSTSSSSPTSSCAENTVMPGLNYLKNQPPVVALADEAYPPWLWELLSPNKELSEKQKLRKDNRAGIKGQNFMAQK